MSFESGFHFQSFQPRTKVRVTVNRMLREFLRETDPSASYRAIVADRGEGFWISLVVRIQGRLYSSDAYWEKSKLQGRVRDWQIEEVARLLLDVRQQIRAAERQRAVSPVPLKTPSDKK